MKEPTLTKEQLLWLQEKISGKNIIYMGVHGSTLYGLDHPDSDIDIKAVYLPSTKQLVRGEALKTYNYKNDELDIEIEVKSMPSFLRSASSCDTNCIDLLHAPDEMCLIKTDMWDSLKEYRSGMYAKNMKGIIGYIRTHSKKYTNKIDRLNEMKDLLEVCSIFTKGVHTVSDVPLCKHYLAKNYKYIKTVTTVRHGEQQYLEVCGKKYIFTWDVEQLTSALENEINRYGERSNKGADKGIDSKSLSHALRVLLQLKEVVTTHDLQFPLKDAEYVMDVKMGYVTDVVEVLDKIDTLYDECMTLLEESSLPDESDISKMEEIVENFYFVDNT